MRSVFRHCVKVMKPHEDWIRAALPSPDGRFLVTSCTDHVRLLSLSSVSRDCMLSVAQTARVVEIATGTIKAEFRGHDNVIENGAFVPRNAVPSIAELVGLKVRLSSSSLLMRYANMRPVCTLDRWNSLLLTMCRSRLL